MQYVLQSPAENKLFPLKKYKFASGSNLTQRHGNAWGIGCKAPRVLNLGFRWKWEVSLMVISLPLGEGNGVLSWG
jgi:hypothetical protein